MNYLKDVSISFIYSFFSLLILTLILSFLNYFDFINGGFFTFFLIFNLVFSVFIGSFLISKKCISNGWFEGLKFGFIYLLIVCLIDCFVFSYSFNFKFLVFSIIILVTSILGGMVGINFRPKK